jgi:hypothetical protein
LGGSLATVAGSSIGISIVSGFGFTGTLTTAAGYSVGLAVVSGLGSSLATESGSSIGVASDAGIGGSLVTATGSAIGVAVVSGTGSSIGTSTGIGYAVGLAIVSGSGQSIVTATGSAIGVAVVSGTRSSIGTSTGIGYAVGSLLLLTPPASLPNDLAGAIALAIAGSLTIAPLTTQGPFNGQASDGVSVQAGPYVVFKIGSDSIEFASSSSQWGNTRIKFECLAVNAKLANDLALAVLATFGSGQTGTPGIHLSFATGLTTPFLMIDRSQSPKPRGKGNSRVFVSCVEYSARTRVGLT